MPQSYKIFFKSKVKSLYFSFISKHKITKILSISKHKNRQKAEHFQQLSLVLRFASLCSQLYSPSSSDASQLKLNFAIPPFTSLHCNSLIFNTALKKVKGSLFISLKSRNFARLFKKGRLP